MTDQAAKVAPKTVEEYLDEQAAEWAQYVAAEPIFIDGVRAFNKGDSVPASHVTRKVVDAAQVTKTGKAN